ncbi:hypothetical protein V5F01_47505, partial [Streptomyces sp. NRRL B-2790]
RAAGVTVTDFAVRRPSLDDVFLSLTGATAAPAHSEDRSENRSDDRSEDRSEDRNEDRSEDRSEEWSAA